MAVVTSAQIAKFFEKYAQIDVTFNKSVISATGLLSDQTYLRLSGMQIPCIIYSTSMIGAKVLANLDTSHFEKIRAANNLVSLRFAFRAVSGSDALAFFASAKIVGFQPYNKSNPKTNFVTLTYTNRPPDDLIEIVGELLDVNVNARRRKEQRITIDETTQRKLQLKSRSAIIEVQGVPRKSILRDLSFSGARVLVVGVAKFLEQKPAVLKLGFTDQSSTVVLPGIVARTESVQGREDISALGLQFDEGKIPMFYKTRLNDFFR